MNYTKEQQIPVDVLSTDEGNERKLIELGIRPPYLQIDYSIKNKTASERKALRKAKKQFKESKEPQRKFEIDNRQGKVTIHFKNNGQVLPGNHSGSKKNFRTTECFKDIRGYEILSLIEMLEKTKKTQATKVLFTPYGNKTEVHEINRN